MGIISLNYGGKNEAPLGDNSVLERARRPWGHSDSLRGKILFPNDATVTLTCDLRRLACAKFRQADIQGRIGYCHCQGFQSQVNQICRVAKIPRWTNTRRDGDGLGSTVSSTYQSALPLRSGSLTRMIRFNNWRISLPVTAYRARPCDKIVFRYA